MHATKYWKKFKSGEKTIFLLFTFCSKESLCRSRSYLAIYICRSIFLFIHLYFCMRVYLSMLILLITSEILNVKSQTFPGPGPHWIGSLDLFSKNCSKGESTADGYAASAIEKRTSEKTNVELCPVSLQTIALLVIRISVHLFYIFIFLFIYPYVHTLF